MSLKQIARILTALVAAATGACSDAEPGGPAPVEKDWTSLIDAERCFADLKAFAAIGGGSHAEGMRERIEKSRTMIRKGLEEAGFAASAILTDSWTQKIPSSDGNGMRSTTMKNITAVLPGRRPEVIAIGAHYDVKILPGGFVGANDGGSGTVLLLELARRLLDQSKRQGPPLFTLQFAFFDGEEAIVDWQARYEDVPDNCYGSRRMAANRKDHPIETLILLDMVADADLRLLYEKSSHPELNRIFCDAGKDFFGIDVFGKSTQIQDDHVAFKEAGMDRVIDLIDFEYGPSNRYWHSTDDTIEHCSARSLAKVGSLVLQALPQVESWLAAQLGN